VRSLRSRPIVRRARRRLDLLARTRRWRPSAIALAASGRTIHVDPADPRGWEIVRGLGRGHQPALIDLWRRALIELAPDLVVDVGANYGELLLNGDYGSATVLAFEPNPTVAGLLRRSVAAHPDRAAITIHEAVASAADGGTAILRIDPAWSGSASVALDGSGRAGDALVEVEVPVRSLDAATAEVPGGRVLLKVDAEGWESAVLAGATELLARPGPFVGVVEFDPDHLRRAGADPADLHALLARRGRCWRVDHDGTATLAGAPPDVACDLLVIDDDDLAHRLLGAAADPTP
jgi:FkbM family methyltransferase